MNDIGPILDAIVFALAILLALIGAAAARRYSDVRFALVGAALAVLALIGLVGLGGLLWPAAVPGAELGTVPALLLIGAEILFYLSFIVARPGTPPPPGA
jgi:hypothetical protein